MVSPTTERGQNASPIQTRDLFKTGQDVKLYLLDEDLPDFVRVEYTDVYGVFGKASDSRDSLTGSTKYTLYPWSAIRSITLLAGDAR